MKRIPSPPPSSDPPSKRTKGASSSLDSFLTTAPRYPTAVATSPPLTDRDSVFSAMIFPARTLNEAKAAIEHVKQRLHRSNPASHEMAAWRFLGPKRGRSGLGGPEDFEVKGGWEDDGEKGGGNRVLRTLEEEGIVEAVVVCSRWYGGTMLGPARFSHIQTVTQTVCRAFQAHEELASLRQTLEALDARILELRGPGTGKAPEYGEDLTVEKAERLVRAREKTVGALEKRRREEEGGGGKGREREREGGKAGEN